MRAARSRLLSQYETNDLEVETQVFLFQHFVARESADECLEVGGEPLIEGGWIVRDAEAVMRGA